MCEVCHYFLIYNGQNDTYLIFPENWIVKLWCICEMKYHVAIINHIYNIYQMTVVILYGLKLDYKTVYVVLFHLL